MKREKIDWAIVLLCFISWGAVIYQLLKYKF